MRHAYPSLGPNLFSKISKTDLGNLCNQISSKGNYISCEILIQNTANTPLDILVWRLSNYVKLNANMSFNPNDDILSFWIFMSFSKLSNSCLYEYLFLLLITDACRDIWPANKHLQEVLQQVVIENFAKDLPLTYCVPKSRLLKQTMNICWDNLV